MENMIVIHGRIDYIYCPVCGRKVRGDLCYTCGNNNLPNFVIPSKNNRQDTCKNCPELDVNYNSDESYCNLADGEEVRLKRGQHRPGWCPKRAMKKLLKGGKEKCTIFFTRSK